MVVADHLFHPTQSALAKAGPGKHGALGVGVVFELSPPKMGQKTWTETEVHAFNGTNGRLPFAGLILDGAGDLYGTTALGGPYKYGVVFKLSPPEAGQSAWTETVLHAFNGADGESPSSSLLEDGSGDLYGTTPYGGAQSQGVVFKLSPPAAGQTAWTERVLRSFNGADGASPSSLIADGAGNLYGTTTFGGRENAGVVFKLTP